MAKKSEDHRYVGIDDLVKLMIFRTKVSEVARYWTWRLEVLKSGDGSRSHEVYSGTEDIGVKYSAQFWRKVFEF